MASGNKTEIWLEESNNTAGSHYNITCSPLEDKTAVDVVQHPHVDSSYIHFFADSIAASTDYILIDISDTTNYGHVLPDVVQLEWFAYDIGADTTANYTVSIGFLENVTATSGDFYEFQRISGSKQVGQNRSEIFPVYPNGGRLSSARVATSVKSIGDTAFQTDVAMRSTLDPTTADVFPGDGDIVIRVTMAAGTISMDLNCGYHTRTA